MQIPQYVRVRGARWRVLDVRAYEDCELVTLAGVSPPYIGVERRFLAPFDVIEPIDRRIRPRVVRAERWRNACRHLLADNRPPGGLEAALHARIDLLPHQLEPALAILRGLGSRVLLADEVGLGKTIQAGLVCAELLVRGAIDRVLVLTPAGLREQWREELLKRFSIARDDRRCLGAAHGGRNPAGRAQSMVDPADRDRVDRLRQAAGGAAGGRGVLVGPGHRGRSARRRRRLRSTRRRQHARRPRGLCALADGDAALRRPPCLRVAVRTRIARRGSSSGLQAQPERRADRRATAGPHHRLFGQAPTSAGCTEALADYTAAVRADRRELPRRLLAGALRPPQTRAVERLVARPIDRSPPRVAAGA